LHCRVLHAGASAAPTNRRGSEAAADAVPHLPQSPARDDVGQPSGIRLPRPLEHTIRAIGSRRQSLLIEGNQETLYDAERIRATGTKVVQINTGAGCHLDAQMLTSGLAKLAPPDGSLVFVENVGNLVCPALFDLARLHAS
jgi:hypothetical protein